VIQFCNKWKLHEELVIVEFEFAKTSRVSVEETFQKRYKIGHAMTIYTENPPFVPKEQLYVVQHAVSFLALLYSLNSTLLRDACISQRSFYSKKQCRQNSIRA